MTFPPTEITFHLLAMHPLGRDYRQDVLGMRNTDKFFVQEGSAESKKGLLGRKMKAFAKNSVRKLINNRLTDAVLMEAYIPKGDSAEVLMSRADLAMYVAKQGGDGFVCFDSMLERSTDQGLSLLSDLRRAVDRNELTLHFQPKMKLPERTCGSVEALVRWRHPTRGMIPPDQFIPFAEETGFIRNITCWVLESACATAAAWARDGRPLGINVNVSTRDLVSMDLPSVVAGVLARQGLNPALLCLEITESAIMGDPTLALASLSRLNEMGVRLSIDDFGTGYSSLAYLKRFPIGKLKIDRSFIQGLPADASDAGIVRAIVQMALALGMQVIAEGVETAEQEAYIIAQGCHEGQGYLYSKPLPARELTAFLKQAQRNQVSIL